MSTLAERVTALADATNLPALKIALTQMAVTSVLAPLPSAADPNFKAANASHQFGLSVIRDPDTCTTQAWLVIVSSDDPLVTADPVTDDLIAAAVAAAWPALSGVAG